MKKFSQIKLALFLLAAIGLSVASAQTDNNRQRVVTPTATPPLRSSPTPTPEPEPPPSRTSSGETLFDLQAKIRQSLTRPQLRRGSVGIKIVSLDTGKLVFEENAEKYFMPASNMKSFTVATALEKLSPNFRFITSVFANSQPDASGTIRGDLTVYGRGDVSFSTAFYEKDYFRALDNLADKIAAAGVKRVEGNLVGDESYFTGSPIPVGWEWDDLQWYWGAEVSALPLNDNALDLSVRPSSVGAPCTVSVQPFNPVVRVVNTCKTTAAGVRRELAVKKDLDQNVLEISGTMPVGDRGFSEPVTVSHPAELFVALLKQRLEQKGVVVTGQPRVVGTKEKNNPSIAPTVAPVQITQIESPPFSLIAAKTMKPSQNMYTETILWTLGEQLGTKSRAASAERGIAVVKSFLSEIGIAPDGIIQYDGSGLSRHNVVTPAALVTLYTYMAKQSRYSNAWLDSLTIGGVDGTLGNRFKGTRTRGNVRGKTGTIDQVSALSGYVTSAAGEKFVFSIIVNGVSDGSSRVGTIDQIVGHLANFEGRIN